MGVDLCTVLKLGLNLLCQLFAQFNSDGVEEEEEQTQTEDEGQVSDTDAGAYAPMSH